MEREAREIESCHRIREILDSYVSGEVSDSERTEVESHLAACAGCACAVEATARLRDAVRGAVERTEGAPTELRDRIRAGVRDQAPASRSAWRPLAAAAALILVAMGGWAAFRYGRETPGSAVARSSSTDEVAFLEVGLKHHVHCVEAAPPGAVAPSPEALEAKLGPDYAGLVAVVREHIPGTLTLADAHRCSSNGRRFVHLVLRGDDGLVSLLVTARSETALPREDAAGAVEASGLRIDSTSEGGLEVSGFATPEYMVYVVSGVTDAPAPLIASAVGPSVRDFLATHRG